MEKPLERLAKVHGRSVIVQMKNGHELRGILDGHDPHMNLVLRDVEEFEAGERLRSHDILLVRGDSVVFISP